MCWGISSYGRARALHARGTGIDTRILQCYVLYHLFQHLPFYVSWNLKLGNILKNIFHLFKCIWELANMAERVLRMDEVPGSIPGFSILRFGTFFCRIFSFVDYRFTKLFIEIFILPYLLGN